MTKQRTRKKFTHNNKSIKQNNSDEINSSWERASSLVNTQMDSQQLGNLLEELTQLDYPIHGLDSNLANRVVLWFCSVITQEESLAASRFCLLITSIILKQKITFSEKTTIELITYFSQLARVASSWLRVDSLRTLSYVVFTIAPPQNIQKHVLETIAPFSGMKEADIELKRQALHCMGSLCAKCGNNMIDGGYKMMLQVLQHNCLVYGQQVWNDSSVLKPLLASLRGLKYAAIEGKSEQIENPSHLLSVLRRLVLFGTSYQIQIQRQYGISSESDLSDTTNDSQSYDNPMRREEIKVRMQTLGVINGLWKRRARSMFGVDKWSQLLPEYDATVSKPFTPSLLTALLYDPIPRIRSASALALSSIIDGSRPFLANQALPPLQKATTGAFVPFSHSLGAMLTQVHEAILYSLEHDNHIISQVSIIKAAGVIMLNTPYEKVRLEDQGIKILEKINKIFMNSSDSGVISTCLCSLCNGFGTKSRLNNLSIEKKAIENFLSLGGESNSSQSNHALHVLTALSKNYPHLLGDHILGVISLVKHSLEKEDQTQRVSAIQMIEQLMAKITVELPWMDIIDDILQQGMKDQFHTVRSNACIGFSHIPKAVFQSIHPAKRLSIISSIFSATNDNAPAVRAAACKTLGVIPSFDIFYKDQTFHEDLYRTLKPLLSDSVLNVRVRGSWALANLCEIVSISSSLFSRVLDLCLKSFQDNEKVQSNSVRGLGNILRNISHSEGFETEEISIVECLIESMENNSPKVRWNAAYALSSLLATTSSISQRVRSLFRQSIQVLSHVLATDKNFKVRIHASAALGSGYSREIYGSALELKEVWEALVSGLECSSDAPNAVEYRYVSDLQQQIGNGLAHIARMTQKEDLESVPSLKNYIEEHWQDIYSLLDNNNHIRDKEHLEQLLTHKQN